MPLYRPDVIAISASDATFQNTVRITGGANITVGTDAQGITISGGAGGAGGIDAAIGGNSTSAGGGYITISAGTMVLAGGNNITLSQNASTITISGPNAGGAQTGISSIQASDATYTSGKVIFTGVGGGITISSNTGQRVDLSVAAPVAQTVQTQNLVDLSFSSAAGGATAGTMALVSSGTLLIAAGNDITISQSGTNNITISANVGLDAMSIGGNSTSAGGGYINISDGAVLIAGGPNITLSQNASTISISGNPAQTVQTQNAVDWSISTTAGGGTAGTMALISSGTVTLFAGNNITISQSGTNTLVISGPNTVAQSAQTQSNIQAVVPLGNTTGTTGSIQTGTIGIAGGANITISQSSGTASTNLTIIGGGGGGVNIAASNTTFTSGTVVMSASGGAITINSAAQSVGFSVPQTSSLSASANITISSNGSTISFSVAPANSFKLGAWQNMPLMDAGPLTYLTAISKTPFYWPEVLPGAVTLNSVGFLASVVTTGTLQSFSVHFGVYTYVNSTSVNLIQSVSETFLLSTATSASFSGQRLFVLTSPSTATGISNLTPGAYVFGSMISAGASASMNLSLYGGTNNSAVGALGVILPGANQASTGTSQGVLPIYGRGSTTVNAMPANVSAADLVNQGSGASAQLHPYMVIRS